MPPLRSRARDAATSQPRFDLVLGWHVHADDLHVVHERQSTGLGRSTPVSTTATMQELHLTLEDALLYTPFGELCGHPSHVRYSQPFADTHRVLAALTRLDAS